MQHLFKSILAFQAKKIKNPFSKEFPENTIDDVFAR